MGGWASYCRDECRRAGPKGAFRGRRRSRRRRGPGGPLHRPLPLAGPTGGAAPPRHTSGGGRRTGRLRRDARVLGHTPRNGQGGRLPPAGRGEPGPVPAATPEGRRQARTDAVAGCAQRRDRRVALRPTRGSPGRAAAAAAAAARGPRPPLLLRPLRSPDRRRDGHQHRRGQEPRLPRRRRTAPDPGVLVMTSYEPDDGFDALLRDSMQSEADTVMPAGDGLSRIQQRVSARRARLRWLRPTVALGSAAVLAVVGGGADAAVDGHNGTVRLDSPPATSGPTDTPTPEPTPSQTSTVPVVHAAFPKRAIFPFTSAKDERAWEQESAQGHSPWQGDAKAVATFWVTNFLHLSSVNQVVRQVSSPTSVDVTLGRMQADASSQRPIAVTTVHLVKYGNAWLVTGATDGRRLLRIAAPTAGTTVTSPVVASGPGGGIHRAAAVQVRDATTPTQYGEGHTGSFGTTQGWSASVSFATPSKPVGVLLVVESSDADGLPIRVAAQQVRFGTSSVSAGSQYFYGIRNGRVTKFSARGGASLDYLTDPKPGGGASDPQLVGSDVYFLRANGSCTNSLSKVPTGGADNTQPEHSVATPDDGYVITGFAVYHGGGGSAGRYSYFEQACDGSTLPQAKLVNIDGGKTRHVVTFDSMPPLIVADPSFEPPAAVQFLDAIVRTGTGTRLLRYDTANTTSPTGARNACRGWDFNNGRPLALETGPTGVLWFATQSGSSMQVVKCPAGGSTAVVAFTVPGNNQPADVDVSPTGSVLLTDTDGDIWRWDGSGDAVKLAPSQPIDAATW